jgi:miniconductance mechanosensitive channel
MVETLRQWLIDQGIGTTLAEQAGWLGAVLGVLILAFLANYIAKKFLLAGVSFFVKRSKTKWDDALIERKLFTRLSHLAPAMVIYYFAPMFLTFQSMIQRFSMVYMILAGLWVFNSFLNAISDIYNTFAVSKQRPIKGYVQVVKIIASVLIGIIAIATFMGQKPGFLLGGLGAMTAVIMLVFKDSILGLVAGVQLSAYDMVRIGDWIEMPKYGVDGDVIDVSLNTVKVQNFDKTIATIPAYSLISDSFKNWRGMSESGGRRIKRAINIDMNSIRFCNDEMLDRYKKFHHLSDYIDSRRKEVARFNAENKIDTSEMINGRNLTNVGSFRAYMVAYLKNHPKIHREMTFLVRQLPPGRHGLPIEIYVFSNDQDWVRYEDIQADIFDHLLAVLPMFDLRVFQDPTGNDFRNWDQAAKQID